MESNIISFHWTKIIPNDPQQSIYFQTDGFEWKLRFIAWRDDLLPSSSPRHHINRVEVLHVGHGRICRLQFPLLVSMNEMITGVLGHLNECVDDDASDYTTGDLIHRHFAYIEEYYFDNNGSIILALNSNPIIPTFLIDTDSDNEQQ